MPISIPLPIAKGGTGEAAQGLSAFSAGNLNIASGESSLAVGYLNEASGENSLAIGYANDAENIASMAIGYENNSTEESSIAIGHSNSASASNANSIGSDNESSNQEANAFGANNFASGVKSNAFGSLNFSYGTNSSSFGCGTTAGGLNSSAFGYFTKTYTDNTAELGVWTSPTQRGGAIRIDSSGIAALTARVGAGPPSNTIGSIIGAEPVGSLPAGCVAFRKSGSLYIDYSDQAGQVFSHPLQIIIGQSSKGISSPREVITFSGTGVYGNTGINATFDSATSIGMQAGLVGGFSLRNIVDNTRLFSVSAAIEVERTLSGTNDIGIKLAKNGTPIDATEIQENTSQNNPAYLTTTWVIELGYLDEVALFIANMTSAQDVQFNRGRIVAIAI